MAKIVVTPIEDLYSQDGTKSFTKGKMYVGQEANVLENVKLKNDYNQDHYIGNWFTKFKRVYGIEERESN